MKLQHLIAIFVLLFHLGNQEVFSWMMADQGQCEFSDEEENLCSSYCYKSVKPPLSYIIELKEQLKVTAQENLDRDQEVKKLRQKLLDMADNTNQIKDLGNKVDRFIASQDHLKDEVVKLLNKVSNENAMEETIKMCHIDVPIDSKSEILRKENENYAVSIKEIENFKVNVKSLKNEIKELNSQISSYKKQLDDFKNVVSDKNHLIEICSQKPKQAINRPSNCLGLSTGIHNIEIPKIEPFSVLCNADIANGGWIVIQKRFDGSENFNRSWSEYRDGFGKLDGEFFIGLEKLNCITNSQPYEIYIKLDFFNGDSKFVRYNKFIIESEGNNYRLLPLSEFEGTDYDGLWFNRNQDFTTYDRDNDNEAKGNCALKNFAGWWYDNCEGPNLNGRYYQSKSKEYDIMSWDGVTSLRSVQMLIRPK